MLKVLSLTSVISMLAMTIVSFSALGDTPGSHPAFLHALTDLRAARWHLGERGGSAKLKEADENAIKEIDACINEIKKASVDDGKALTDHPGEDAGKDKAGNVHRAHELLEKAKKDISGKEDNKFANGLRDRAIHHLDEALKHVDHAIAIKE